ncbi:MAG: hypothetical protein HY864_11425 [Chloroflexi bacterium]|nr:hypothetical protein [Chloroflexota bacterium]
MKKKSVYLLFTAFAIILYSLVFRLYFFKDANFRAYTVFTGVFHQLFLAICLLIFLGIVWSGSSKPSRMDNQQPPKIGFWRDGFSWIMLIALTLALCVNPHARFSSTRFPSITPSARTIKMELYKELETSPAIIVLGSSRAFTLAPQYIKNNFNVSAFNMSVEGGNVIDYSIELKHIINYSDITPHVLIIEVGQGSFYKNQTYNVDLQPLALLPYMPPNMAVLVIISSLQDVFGLQSISDSVFISTLTNLEGRFRGWTFEKNGCGVRKPITHEGYEKLLKIMIDEIANLDQCDEVNWAAMEVFESILASAKKSNIAVVLYESPMHKDYYNALHDSSSPGYEYCADLYRTHLVSLADSYPNVFFRDLSEYELVNNLGEDGFYDGIHLRPNASELVIDALTPEIESALTWSRRQVSP